MDKILITGFSGFVARHYLELLCNESNNCTVLGIDIKEPNYDYRQYSEQMNVEFMRVNMLDEIRVQSVISDFLPNYILHLASYSSVAYSWKNPNESFTNNTNIFLNLIEAVRKTTPDCRILSVGSSEEYGYFEHRDLPLHEDHALKPLSPYSVARVSQEMLSKVFVDGFGMNIIMTRSFNHIGPYQDDRFVVPGFVSRALMNMGDSTEVTIETGNLSIIRDFVDVRDVVKAYDKLLRFGRVGEVYNICSGNPISLKDIIMLIGESLKISINTIVNPDFLRPGEIMTIYGNNEKIKREIGWYPEIKIEDTIFDLCEEMRSR